MLAALALFLSLSQTTAAEPRERYSDLIHSDLPLWHSGSDNMWPRASRDSDGSFGCESRVRFGDWRYDESGEDTEPHWYRITNYGVFHCFATVTDSSERSALDDSNPDPSFLIELGTVSVNRDTIELWALQRGARPGSDYLLLARRPAVGRVEAFDVLERECPQDRSREGPDLSILITRYCAINSKEELIELARQMASRPPLGRLTFVALVPRRS